MNFGLLIRLLISFSLCIEPGEERESRLLPLVTHIYVADPSAHLFDGRIFLYCSHDTITGTPYNSAGDQYDMRDYHILSMDSVGGRVIDHGIGLDIKNVPWAKRQLWAPDAAFANGKYYLYFPAKDRDDIFRIGVAVSDRPEGPFIPEPKPIVGSYSIDPCIFRDDDGSFYLYFGGIWGGQLQNWRGNIYDPSAERRSGSETAVLPRVARMGKDMTSFAGEVMEVQLLSREGYPFTESENDKRYFESPWVFKHGGRYYFTYSTGDTHLLCYAVGDSPYGPFTYRGVILNPVNGWTTHHSIVQINKQWFLFYHDSMRSGKSTLRDVKVTPLLFNPDGSIVTLTVPK